MKTQPITPWFQRKFNPVDQEAFFELLERLASTPVRIKEKLTGIPGPVLRAKTGNEWSILENIGHLADLEPLWIGRVADIVDGLEYLRSADLTNQKTYLADHNSRDRDAVIREFEILRADFLTSLKELEAVDLEKIALHPRLKTPMKMVDLMHFVAEHDDHHLATCALLLKSFDELKDFKS